MLMKLMCSNGDFEKTLRRRRLFAFGLLALGILGICCYLFLLADSAALPDFARGFYFGASCGIALAGVYLLIRAQVLLADPDRRKKARVQEMDERERAITNQAFLFAGMLTFFLCAAATLVLVAVSRPAALAVFAVILVYFLAFLCAAAYLSKKL